MTSFQTLSGNEGSLSPKATSIHPSEPGNAGSRNSRIGGRHAERYQPWLALLDRLPSTLHDDATISIRCYNRCNSPPHHNTRAELTQYTSVVDTCTLFCTVSLLLVGQMANAFDRKPTMLASVFYSLLEVQFTEQLSPLRCLL
jgi:hypothetical protein